MRYSYRNSVCLSVCLSVQWLLVLCLNECTHHQASLPHGRGPSLISYTSTKPRATKFATATYFLWLMSILALVVKGLVLVFVLITQYTLLVRLTKCSKYLQWFRRCWLIFTYLTFSAITVLWSTYLGQWLWSAVVHYARFPSLSKYNLVARSQTVCAYVGCHEIWVIRIDTVQLSSYGPILYCFWAT